MNFKSALVALAFFGAITFSYSSAFCARTGGVGGGGSIRTPDVPREDFRYDCKVEVSEQFNGWRQAEAKFSVTRNDVMSGMGRSTDLTTTAEMFKASEGFEMPTRLAGHKIYFSFGIEGSRNEGKAMLTADIMDGYVSARISAVNDVADKRKFFASGHLANGTNAHADQNGLHDDLILSLDVTCQRKY